MSKNIESMMKVLIVIATILAMIFTTDKIIKTGKEKRIEEGFKIIHSAIEQNEFLPDDLKTVLIEIGGDKYEKN